jgi:hypothetical protein
VTPNGTIRASAKPGIGYAPRMDRIDTLTVKHEVLK